MLQEALNILRESIVEVPAVKYAFGVAGMAAALLIIKSFRLGWKIVSFGLVLLMGMMIMLVIFARYILISNDPSFIYLMITMTWSIFFIFITTILFLVSSVFFGKPLDLRWIFDKQKVPPKEIQ